MKKTYFYAVAVLVSSVLSAQQAIAEIKIGTVNVPKVMEVAPQAEEARQRLKREFEPKEQQLLRQENDIVALEERLAKDRAIMTESKILDMQRDVNSKKRDYRRDRDEFREDRNIRYNEELSKLQEEVLSVIQEIAKDDNFDLILTDGFVWASENVDITDRVLKKLK